MTTIRKLAVILPVILMLLSMTTTDVMAQDVDLVVQLINVDPLGPPPEGLDLQFQVSHWDYTQNPPVLDIFIYDDLDIIDMDDGWYMITVEEPEGGFDTSWHEWRVIIEDAGWTGVDPAGNAYPWVSFWTERQIEWDIQEVE